MDERAGQLRHPRVRSTNNNTQYHTNTHTHTHTRVARYGTTVTNTECVWFISEAIILQNQGIQGMLAQEYDAAFETPRVNNT
jgi:hypothetical protein